MNTWAEKIAECIENESKRHYLKPIPLALISAIEYLPPWWYWEDFLKCVRN